MRKQPICQIVVALLAMLALVTGCAPNPPRFVDEGASYSADQALELPLDINSGAVAGRPASEAAETRSETLAALRREGGDRAEIAALITTTIPSKSPGVPIYIELAEVDRVPAVIVIEAVGPRGGKLDGKRVWVLDRSGRVLLMGDR